MAVPLDDDTQRVKIKKDPDEIARETFDCSMDRWMAALISVASALSKNHQDARVNMKGNVGEVTHDEKNAVDIFDGHV